MKPNPHRLLSTDNTYENVFENEKWELLSISLSVWKKKNLCRSLFTENDLVDEVFQ